MLLVNAYSMKTSEKYSLWCNKKAVLTKIHYIKIKQTKIKLFTFFCIFFSSVHFLFQNVLKQRFMLEVFSFFLHFYLDDVCNRSIDRTNKCGQMCRFAYNLSSTFRFMSILNLNLFLYNFFITSFKYYINTPVP